MFKEIIPSYKKFTEYSIYLFILLILLDIISTFVGIKYFNAFEANKKTAYLFGLFGMLLPSGLKFVMSLILIYNIKIIWKKSESLLSNKSKWVNSIAVFSSLNLLVVILSLNVVYFVIVINNLNIIYGYI